MAHDAARGAETRTAVRRAAVRMLAFWIVLPLVFLAAGGALDWWWAWIYCAVLLVPMTVFVAWTARRDPGFFERRFKVREKESAQRRIQAWGSLAYFAVFVVPGLDHRFGWSEPPRAASAAAMVLCLAGYLGVLRVFRENRWAGRTVETWSEQTVVSTGPYALVRHPMYTATLVFLLATPVALGSWWGLAAAVACLPLFVLRIRNEEDVLVRELPGYEDYRRAVRFRLVPGVW